MEEKNVSSRLYKKKTVEGHYNTLVLAGGSTRGIAALGALHYLYSTEKTLSLYLTNFIGCSSGAIIAYLLCIGYTPLELITYMVRTSFLKNMQFYNIMNLVENRGVLNWTWIQEHLENWTIAKLGRFPTMGDLSNNLNRNFTCVAYNETKNCTEYLNATTAYDLPCITAIRMSCAVPILFDRFQYNGSVYIDGAFGDNFPLLYADKEDNLSLCVNFVDNASPEHNSVLSYMYYLFMIPIEQQVDAQIRKVSNRATIINVDARKIRSFNFDLSTQQKMEIFSQGYREAKLCMTNE